MNEDVYHLVQAIHAAPPRVALVTAGAGTTALSDLLGVVGASGTVLESLVPYSGTSMDDYLGQRPKQYVSAKTAKLLAGRALTRARWLETEGRPSIGLACTATIITNRPKRGDHRAHIACWTPERLVWRCIVLDKGARDRSGEENVISRLMLNMLAEACGLEQRIDVPLLPKDKLQESVDYFASATAELLANNLPFFGIHDHGMIRTSGVQPQVLLSGAFNPLHDGHLGMSRAATTMTQQPVAFELAAVNVDKPPLPADIILDRIAQFAGRYPIYISRAPTFLEKARLYPNCTFVVGYDTAVRILHPRYYQDSSEAMLAALAEIASQGCSFLVAGRVSEDGRFHTAADLEAPNDYGRLFASIPERYFRQDISSTELRQRQMKGSR